MRHPTQHRHWWTLAGLAALMAATRFHHFGSITTLPDASLAVFFLAGLAVTSQGSGGAARATIATDRWLQQFGVFLALLFEAALIDYLAIRHGGVSDWCVTPAYGFLIPTYGVMFLAGMYCARFAAANAVAVVRSGAILAASAMVAFVISDGSFYLFSGRFPAMGWDEFAWRTAPYALSYVGYTVLYCGFAAALCWMLSAGWQSMRQTASKAS